jgi:hypothetical protein
VALARTEEPLPAMTNGTATMLPPGRELHPGRDSGDLVRADFGLAGTEQWYAYLFKRIHLSNLLSTVDPESPHPIGTAGDAMWATGNWRYIRAKDRLPMWSQARRPRVVAKRRKQER